MKTLLFIAAGLAAGVFSGALGVGGALLATPLIRFLGVTPYLAVGTTVLSILPSTVTGAWTYARAGFVDKRAAGWTALTGSLFTILGALLTRKVDGHLLMLATAGFLMVLSIKLLPGKKTSEPGAATDIPVAPVWQLSLIGVGAGFFSGLLGIGGGFVLVPVFTQWLHFPLKTSLGTSLSVIAITVIPNIATHAYVGNIDWKVALLLAVGVVPGARIGALAAIKAPERTLRLIVAVSLICVATGYGALELTQLSSE
ncbi:MAG TPA: sulfite exporter TauE/SafE family protein [Actinomycetota bacterium]|nr:sulfite exporter TauE/SafE family protein [Actinomycetota bacterium]